MKEVLIVDGYNIIGAWPLLIELKKENMELARDELVEILKEYQSATAMEVILVFDAHQIPGFKKEYWLGKVQVIFSKEDETADDVIERIVHEMEKRASHIYVATSDQAEQQITFGEGALRISARELEALVKEAQKSIQKEINKLDKKRNLLSDQLDKEIAEIFEKWRRNT